MRKKGRGSMKKRKKLVMERRRRRILSGVIALVLAVSLGVGLFMNSGTTTQAAGRTVVDPDTTNVWSDIAASSTSTQNIGRIWTDKSVFDDDYKFSGALAGQTISKGEDSDFLVSLSALSSTSNTTRTVTVGTPVDIVLVLDESGSMEYGFDNRNTRREALQEAANNFIDSANEANQGVPQENQIRMSIVTFFNGADVAQGWTYVTGEGTQSLHNTIGDLDQLGATRTDLGLSEADEHSSNLGKSSASTDS